MPSRGELVELIEELLLAGPEQTGGGLADQCFGPLSLRWLAGEVSIRGHSLSTGYGHVSALAIAASAQHTIVSAEVAPRRKLERWCADHAIATTTTRYEHVSPDRWDPGATPLDLQLLVLNGDQRFPTPILDWHRLSPHLVPGGLLVLADVERRPARILADYLHHGTTNWKRAAQIAGVAVFAKLAPEGGVPRGRRWLRRRPTLDDLLESARRAMTRAGRGRR